MRRVWFGSALNRNGVKQQSPYQTHADIKMAGREAPGTNQRQNCTRICRALMAPRNHHQVCCCHHLHLYTASAAQNDKKRLFPRPAWSLALSRDTTLTFEDTVSCICAIHFLSLLRAKVAGCCVSTSPCCVPLAVCPP